MYLILIGDKSGKKSEIQKNRMLNMRNIRRNLRDISNPFKHQNVK